MKVCNQYCHNYMWVCVCCCRDCNLLNTDLALCFVLCRQHRWITSHHPTQRECNRTVYTWNHNYTLNNWGHTCIAKQICRWFPYNKIQDLECQKTYTEPWLHIKVSTHTKLMPLHCDYRVFTRQISKMHIITIKEKGRWTVARHILRVLCNVHVH